MQLTQLLLVTHGNSSRKQEMLMSVVLYSLMVCYATVKYSQLIKLIFTFPMVFISSQSDIYIYILRKLQYSKF